MHLFTFENYLFRRHIAIQNCNRSFNPSSRVCNSKVTDPIRPEFEHVQDFMPVLVTSKFDEDLIKNERASLETPFSHCKSMGNFLDTQGHLGPIWPNFELVQDFMPVPVTCKFEKDLITRGPLVLYRSPECWRYAKISGYWGKEV